MRRGGLFDSSNDRFVANGEAHPALVSVEVIAAQAESIIAQRLKTAVEPCVAFITEVHIIPL